MSATLLRRGKNMPAPLFAALLNAWPPFKAAGIAVDYVRRDYRAIHVSLALHWYNRNYVGTHFGGALYTMTDPFFMLMLLRILGPGHIVWDKSASIRFRRPGKGRVSVLFRIEDHELAQLQAELAARGKAEFVKTVRIVDACLQTVAEVDKVVYVRVARPPV
ncbi:MAG: DUF4442 domain-containing protein [Candidatus Sericytochromatia bacterium]